MASSIYQQGKDLFYQQSGADTLTKIANPTELQSLAKSGAIEVGKAYKPYESFKAPVVPQTISTDLLTKPTNVSLPPTPQMPDYGAMLKSIPTMDVSQFKSTADETISQAETANKSLGTRILDVVKGIGGKSAALQEAQQKAGVFDYQKQLTDINNQIQQLQKENAITKLDAQGQPIAQEEISKQTADADRRYAVKALGLSSIAQTLQGNLASANDLATRSIDAEFGAMENELQYLQTALDMNKDTLTRAERKRADELQVYIDSQKEQIAAAKEEKKNIFDVMTEAAKNGADALTLNKIMGAKTAAEALSMAGDYLQDTSQKVIGTEATGYYERQPDGTYKQVVAPYIKPISSDVSESDIRTLANSIYDKDSTITSYDQAYAKARMILMGQGSGGFYGGGADIQPSAQTQSSMTFDQYVAQKEQEAGMSFGTKKRQELKAEYDLMNDAFGSQQTQKIVNPDVSSGGRRKDDKYWSQANTFRDDYNGRIDKSGYLTQKQGFDQAQLVSENSKNGADHIALVYAFMKVQDPGSVVREGEFATAQKYSGSLQDRFGIKLENLMNGVLLTADQIRKIKQTMNSRFDVSKKDYEKLINSFERQAKSAKVDPEDFIVDYSTTNPTGQFSSYIEGLGKTNDLGKSQNYPSDTLRKTVEAIGQYESGGRYNALGPVLPSGAYAGDRAYGKYQVMGKNIPSWTKEAIGVSMTPKQFLNDPKAQDAVAAYKMGKYLTQYGTPADVASIWLSGKPFQGNRAKDLATGVSVPQYVKSVEALYNKIA